MVSFGIDEVVITTGDYNAVLVDYCNALHLPLKFTFVNNPIYKKTNYIYSIYCAKDELKDHDILLMHGDLVFENLIMEAVMDSEKSCMAVSSTLPLPEKDFKAVAKDGKIEKVGIEFFDNAVAAQPQRKLAIVSDNFAYIYNKNDGSEELYNMVNYRMERCNL